MTLPGTPAPPIPKRLHFIWIGDESQCPQACIDSWRKHNPEFEVKVWGNKEFEQGDWIFRQQMNAIWETGQIYGVADLMRWEILYKEGGIALDADSFCLAPIPEWLLSCTAFACWQNEIQKPGLISNGYVGAAHNNPLVHEIIETLRKEKDLAHYTKYFGLKKKRRTSWKTTGPQIITDCHKSINYHELTILPSHFFIPRDHQGKHYRGNGPVIAMQFFGSTRSSRFSYSELAKLSREEIMERLNAEH